MEWTSWLLVWVPLLAVGAALSQAAEFGHLHYARDWPFGYAYLFALAFVLAEYACSIKAERELYALGASLPLQYMAWNLMQVVSNAVLVVVLAGRRLNGFHWTSYVLLVVAVGLAFLGDRADAALAGDRDDDEGRGPLVLP
jgi:hypothetical protein